MQLILMRAQRVSLQAIGPDGYKALGAMLRVRLQPLRLTLPALQADATPETRMEHERVRIEVRWNIIRNGRAFQVASQQVEWVQFSIEVNESFVTEATDYDPAFNVSCLLAMLELIPNVLQA